MLKRILYTVLFLVFLSPLWAQEYTVDVKHFSTEDGLIHRAVANVLEDEYGFMWLASERGLQRFDGRDFKTWSQANGYANLENITAMALDKEGWLWAYNNTLEEFIFIHTLTEEILTENERFGPTFPIKRKRLNSFWYSSILRLKNDDQGRIVFAISNPNALIRYDSGGVFDKVPLPQFDNKGLDVEAIDNHGNVWIREFLYGKNLYKVSPTGELLATYSFNSTIAVEEFSSKLGGLLAWESLKDSFRMWQVSTEYPYQKSLLPFSYHVMGLYPKTAWVINENEWIVLDNKLDQILFSLKRKDYDRSLFDLIRAPYQDSRGRFWVAGQWGLSMVNVKPSSFNRYLEPNSARYGDFNNSTRGIVVTEETVFVNLEFEGLAAVPKDEPANWKLIDKKESDIEDYRGRPLIKLKSGDLASGVRNEIKIFSSDGTLKQVYPSFGIHDVWSLWEDEQTFLWVGSGKGLAVLKPGQDSIVPVFDIELFSQGSNDIFHISELEPGLLLMCTALGPITYNKASGKAQNLTDETTRASPFPSGIYYWHHRDGSGVHWLGSNRGLIRWDREKDEVRRFTTLDGLPNDVIYAILEDQDENLWLSSDNGIVQFDMQGFQVRAYGVKDGLPHAEFNRLSAYQDRDGALYFGGVNGLASFHPDQFQPNLDAEPFEMRIADFKIFDGEADSLLDRSGALKLTHQIEFLPDDRFFRLQFCIPILDEPGRAVYAWKLEGLDTKWHYQKDNFILMSSLPYGDYTLRIKGQGDRGVWTKELVIEIKVVAPFYLQLWFLGLMALVLLVAFFLIVKARTRRLRKRQVELEAEVMKATMQIEDDKRTIELQANELLELDKVKSRFFANVSHELRTPLSLILGPIGSAIKSGELGQDNLRFLKQARVSGKNLLKLVGAILDLSKMESGKMQLLEKPVHAFEFTRRLVSTFESYAQQAGLDLIFEYKADKELVIEVDQGKLETVLTNFLSNAVKYSPSGGRIQVGIEDRGKLMLLTVKDAGRGIHSDDLPHVFDRFYQSRQLDAKTEGGTGIGLALCREIASIMGGKVEVESELGAGSTFSFSFPRKEVLGVVLPQDELLDPVELEEVEFSLIRGNANATHSILIVEDNSSLRSYLQSILKRTYRVETAENGRVALDKLKRLDKGELPSLILSDIMMPEMDGYQLLEHLKQTPAYNLIPVIMLTARAAVEDKLKALRIGVDDYLLKPFEEEELVVRIQSLLRNAESRASSVIDKEVPEVFVGTSKEDLIWLGKFEEYVSQILGSDLLTVTHLADEFGMSQSTLLRQLKRLTGLSPTKYIQECRLSKARTHLEEKSYNTIAQVAYEVGFKDAKAFTRSFKQRFGKIPSDFI